MKINIKGKKERKVKEMDKQRRKRDKNSR